MMIKKSPLVGQYTLTPWLEPRGFGQPIILRHLKLSDPFPNYPKREVEVAHEVKWELLSPPKFWEPPTDIHVRYPNFVAENIRRIEKECFYNVSGDCRTGGFGGCEQVKVMKLQKVIF
jgi:hypothetical protein